MWSQYRVLHYASGVTLNHSSFGVWHWITHHLGDDTGITHHLGCYTGITLHLGRNTYADGCLLWKRHNVHQSQQWEKPLCCVKSWMHVNILLAAEVSYWRILGPLLWWISSRFSELNSVPCCLQSILHPNQREAVLHITMKDFHCCLFSDFFFITFELFSWWKVTWDLRQSQTVRAIGVTGPMVK